MLETVENFVQAETALQCDRFVANAGGSNRWVHNRLPTPLDKQHVVWMNRDTLYSLATPSRREWSHPGYDQASYARTRDLLLGLAPGIPDARRM